MSEQEQDGQEHLGKKEPQEKEVSHQEKDNLKSINIIQPEMGSPTNKVKERIEKFSKGIYENEQVPPHESKTDYKQGWGGKFGKQTDRVDKCALDWTYHEEITKHGSTKDYKNGWGGQYGLQTDRVDKSAVGYSYHEVAKNDNQSKICKEDFEGLVSASRREYENRINHSDEEHDLTTPKAHPKKLFINGGVPLPIAKIEQEQIKIHDHIQTETFPMPLGKKLVINEGDPPPTARIEQKQTKIHDHIQTETVPMPLKMPIYKPTEHHTNEVKDPAPKPMAPQFRTGTKPETSRTQEVDGKKEYDLTTPKAHLKKLVINGGDPPPTARIEQKQTKIHDHIQTETVPMSLKMPIYKPTEQHTNEVKDPASKPMAPQFRAETKPGTNRTQEVDGKKEHDLTASKAHPKKLVFNSGDPPPTARIEQKQTKIHDHIQTETVPMSLKMPIYKPTEHHTNEVKDPAPKPMAPQFRTGTKPETSRTQEVDGKKTMSVEEIINVVHQQDLTRALVPLNNSDRNKELKRKLSELSGRGGSIKSNVVMMAMDKYFDDEQNKEFNAEFAGPQSDPDLVRAICYAGRIFEETNSPHLVVFDKFEQEYKNKYFTDLPTIINLLIAPIRFFISPASGIRAALEIIINYKDVFIALAKLFEGSEASEHDSDLIYENAVIKGNSIGWVKYELVKSKELGKDWFCRHVLTMKFLIRRKCFYFETKKDFERALKEAKEIKKEMHEQGRT